MFEINMTPTASFGLYIWRLVTELEQCLLQQFEILC